MATPNWAVRQVKSRFSQHKGNHKNESKANISRFTMVPKPHILEIRPQQAAKQINTYEFADSLIRNAEMKRSDEIIQDADLLLKTWRSLLPVIQRKSIAELYESNDVNSLSYQIQQLREEIKRKDEEIKKKQEENNFLLQKIKDLSCQNEKLSDELGRARRQQSSMTSIYLQSDSKSDPDEVDNLFRGRKNSELLEEVSHFFGLGSYASAINEMDDFEAGELGQLMFTLTMLCYEKAMDVSLTAVKEKLACLFKLHGNVITPEQRQELEHVHHAYGLLVSHCNSDPKEYMDKIETLVMQEIEGREGNHLRSLVLKALHGKNKELFRKFFTDLLYQSVNMVTISPPMILHYQQKFDSKLVLPMKSRNPKPPLQWVQPVLMRNLYGHVCVKGRADNEKLLQSS